MSAPRRVVITGASSGLGAALARHYAARGAQLGLIARRADTLAALAGELGARHSICAADVADANGMRAAAAEIMAALGTPDLVIANAGVSAGTLTEEPDDYAAFERVMRTNWLGLVGTFAPFIPAMRRAGGGRLAGIASVAGLRGLPGAGAYSSSKAAAITYLEALRVELAASGIGVSTICPGYIATPMTAVNRYPMPFLLSADEAARRIARCIERGARYAVVPWQMAIVAPLLRALPDALYDALAARAGRKPRGLPL